MSRLFDMREGIVTALRERLTVLKTVEGHGGRFDLDELKRVSVRAPGAFVALVGAPIEIVGQQPVAVARWAVFIVLKNEPTLPQKKRDELALVVSESIVKVVFGNTWGVDGAQAPKAARIENLFSTKIDALGIALAAVTWEQRVELGSQVEPADFDDFLTFTATYSVGAGDPTTDTVALEHE